MWKKAAAVVPDTNVLFWQAQFETWLPMASTSEVWSVLVCTGGGAQPIRAWPQITGSFSGLARPTFGMAIVSEFEWAGKAHNAVTWHRSPECLLRVVSAHSESIDSGRSIPFVKIVTLMARARRQRP